MTLTDSPSPFFAPPEPDLQVQWIDQLAQEVLLTVQAFQRLQQALKGKMIGG